MAPKKSIRKRTISLSPRSKRNVSMKLRSGSVGKRMIDQEASSRVMPLDTPPKKRGRHSKRCIFIDDEAAQVEEDSNNVNDETEATGTHEVKDQNEEMSKESEEDAEEDVEDMPKHSRHLGKQVPLGLMQDVLGQFYIKKKSQPPLVPLCRLVAHEAVRFATADATWLIPSFDSAAYLETMGHFLVSLTGPSGGIMPITKQNLEDWGPIWRQKNLEFERSLGKDWQDLKGNKFLVWDGNHRLKTWWKRIMEMYHDRPEYHVSVRCQFIAVDKSKEAELLLALDTTNAISRAHVTPNIAHEVYMFQKFGIANKDSIMERLTPDQRQWAEVEMKIESRYYHGVPPWYNTPCGLIAQLVWKDEYSAFISKATANLKALGLQDKEMAIRLEKAVKSEEARLKDRGYKYLSIANPSNGEEFFKLLYGLKWDDPSMLKITRDKLYCLSSSKIPPERKKIILHLMSLTKAKDPQYSHFGDYKTFRGYMRKETYWAHLHTEAWLIIQKMEVEGPQLPSNFEEYYKISLKNHVLEAFVFLLDSVKSSDDLDKMPELAFTAKRLIYRWLHESLKNLELDEMPAITKEWIDVRDNSTMYSPSLIARGLSLWETNVCPWWLDYPTGVIPKQEMDLHAKFKEDTHLHTDMEESADLQDPVTQSTSEDVPTVQSVQDRKGKKAMEPLSTSPEPSRIEVPESSKKHSSMPASSFVAESSLGRSNWERRPQIRQVGFQYTTIVDALLVDITQIDTFALESIEKFLGAQKLDVYNKAGAPCREVARLIFADFPTGLLVDGLDPVSYGKDMVVPKWNVFSTSLVTGTMDLAHKYLADEGFLVTVCLAEHIGEFLKDAARVGLVLYRTWTLFSCEKQAYRHPITGEAVVDLTICLWHRVGHDTPTYNKEAGEELDPVSFPASRSYIFGGNAHPTVVDGMPIRGGAEKSLLFFRWLLATFTNPHDYVLDVFAGCGGLGQASSEDGRNCMCLEVDELLHRECLSTIACGPMPSTVRV